MPSRNLVPRPSAFDRLATLATERQLETLALSDNAEPSSCAVVILDASTSMGFSIQRADEQPFQTDRPTQRGNGGISKSRQSRRDNGELLPVSRDPLRWQRHCCPGLHTRRGLSAQTRASPWWNAPWPSPTSSRPTSLAAGRTTCLSSIWIHANPSSSQSRTVAPLIMMMCSKRRANESANWKSGGHIAFFLAYTDGTAEMERLRRLVVRAPRPLANFNYSSMFRWFAATMNVMSRSVPGEDYSVPNPDEFGWEII